MCIYVYVCFFSVSLLVSWRSIYDPSTINLHLIYPSFNLFIFLSFLLSFYLSINQSCICLHVCLSIIHRNPSVSASLYACPFSLSNCDVCVRERVDRSKKIRWIRRVENGGREKRDLQGLRKNCRGHEFEILEIRIDTTITNHAVVQWRKIVRKGGFHLFWKIFSLREKIDRYPHQLLLLPLKNKTHAQSA